MRRGCPDEEDGPQCVKWCPKEALELIPEGFLPAPGQVENCRSADLGARFALTRGEAGVARRYVDYALAKGYFEPGFIDFCRRYELCELP